MKYRAEIDGLRAVAVVPVVLFHALGLPRAGFLGVDVFFVISGFLITTIIVHGLEGGSFSLTEFYMRRVRRILPALLVMMLVCVPPAYLLMLPDDLENFGHSLVGTVFFANNLVLYRTAGYFDLESEFKPLIHTWSLGVEEQYYLAAPLAMWACYAVCRRRGVICGVALVTLASFAGSLWLASVDPDANFYLIVSRAWELGAGALTALLLPRIPARARTGIRADALAVLGLASILAAMLLLHADMGLPGWATLLPVIGSCLVLLFARPEAGAGRLLGARPMVFIGLISYSLYLYHQPVLAFGRVVRLQEPGPLYYMLLLPAILGLAWLSWRWVEQPFRNLTAVPHTRVLRFCILLACMLAPAGIGLHLTSGLYRSWPELTEGDPGFGANQNAEYNLRPYRYKGVPLAAADPRPKVLVLGNSFARDFLNALTENHPPGSLALSYSDRGLPCFTPLPADLVGSARAADLVVLGSGVAAHQVACFQHRVSELRRLTRARVVVLGTKSFGWNNNAVMLLPRRERYTLRVAPLTEAATDNAEARRALGSEVYVDILGTLADKHGRVPVFTPERKFISQDRKHLTQAGARYVGRLLLARTPALELLRPPGSAAAPRVEVEHRSLETYARIAAGAS